MESVSAGPRRNGRGEMADAESWQTSDLGELQIGKATGKGGRIQDVLGVWGSCNTVVGIEKFPGNAKFDNFEQL